MTIPLFRPTFPSATRAAILADIDRILESGALMPGPHNQALEAALRTMVGVEHAATVNSCTTALTVALSYLGVQGGEVLVSSAAFITSVSSIMFAGGTPVLVDINPRTLSFSLDDLRRKVTSKTRGLVWVHLTGVISPEAEQIMAFAGENRLFIVEDCAHALGASLGRYQAGAMGDAACFSFYPTKIVTSGTGGALVTRISALDAYARKMRVFGKDPRTNVVDALGNDWFLDEIRACVAEHHLRCLPEQAGRRQSIAARYNSAFSSLPGIELPDVPPYSRPSYYQYPVLLRDRACQEQVAQRLADLHGIQSKKIYLPTHEEACLKFLDDGTLRQSEETLHRSLCLPIHPAMSDLEVEKVIDSFQKELAELPKR